MKTSYKLKLSEVKSLTKDFTDKKAFVRLLKEDKYNFDFVVKHLPQSYKNILFIYRSRKSHGRKYNYSLVEYKNNRSKITIICPYHGKFDQTAEHHKLGKGCRRCSNNIKKSNSVFVKEAKRVHGDKYNYSLVE